MFTKPKFESPITTLEELERQLGQNKISLAIESGVFLESYMQTALPGTLPNLLYKQAVVVPQLSREEKVLYGSSCYAAKLAKQTGNGRVASVCDLGTGFWQLMGKDFSTSETCNFYSVEEGLLSSYGPAAFPVN